MWVDSKGKISEQIFNLTFKDDTASSGLQSRSTMTFVVLIGGFQDFNHVDKRVIRIT